MSEHENGNNQDKTKEIKIIEFSIGEILYAAEIDVIKEVIKKNLDIVSVPNAHASVLGAINLRGSIIPVVDMGKQLNKEIDMDSNLSRIIICDLRNITVGFLVSTVDNIRTVSQNELEKTSGLLQDAGKYTVGTLKIDEKVLFVLDFEKVVDQVEFN